MNNESNYILKQQPDLEWKRNVTLGSTFLYLFPPLDVLPIIVFFPFPELDPFFPCPLDGGVVNGLSKSFLLIPCNPPQQIPSWDLIPS
jgi:hypothetical protein